MACVITQPKMSMNKMFQLQHIVLNLQKRIKMQIFPFVLTYSIQVDFDQIKYSAYQSSDYITFFPLDAYMQLQLHATKNQQQKEFI